MTLLVHWVISTIAIIITAYILPGVMIDSLFTALVLAVVFGMINAFLKPLIILLTLPINILTLGLFSLVINALLVMLADMIVPGFSVSNFLWAFIFAIVLALVSAVLSHFGREE